VRFMTINLALVPGTNAERRIQTFAEFANALQVDVLGVQEVHRYRYLEHLTRALNGLPYRQFHSGRFGPAGGIVTFSSTNFSSVRYVSMAEVSYNLGFTTLWKHRGLGAAHKGLLIAETNGVVTANAHCTPRYVSGPWSPDYRGEIIQAAQMGQIAAQMRRLACAPRRVLFGDMNVDKSGQLYTWLQARTGLIDPFDDTPTCTAMDMSQQCLDWMLFGSRDGEVRFEQPRILFPRKSFRHIRHALVSDHSAPCVDVLWPEPAMVSP
jgi:hypothetical protein